MEAPISKNGHVCFSMFVVQTIQLAPQLDRDCFISPISFPAADDESCRCYPSWLGAYNKLHSTYADSLCLKLDSSATPLADISSELRGSSEVLASRSLEVTKLDAFLFYEPHLRQWLIIYELGLSTSEEDLLSLLKATPSCNAPQEEDDLYNALRNEFVISERSETKAPFVARIEEQAVVQVMHQLSRLYDISANDPAKIEIVESSGNITLFFPPLETEADRGLGLFTHTHERAERIGQEAQPLTVDEVDLYVFWGRFHTIVSASKGIVKRFMPIQFQAQLLWSYLSKINREMQEMERGILAESLSSKDDSMDFMDALSNSVHYAIMMNEDFKRSVEGDNAKVYAPISRRWHLDDTLKRAREFSSFLSDHIDSAIKKKSLKSEERQNRALSAIAILGVLALVETWSNYLSLLQEESYKVAESGLMHTIFGSGDMLLVFNTCFPIVLFAICIIITVWIIAKH